ncbi:cleavage induced hypothetical protein [Phytophthora infestans T30-4]|uniref:DNA replication checkpoint mediator MRC1 domain-containing protein n=1 Tax=Phytophthora infestans (strain T30-4) TaxID=403677 RepID=D0NX70_PHYIT|nr:cleavage induced hypothetical protein [Phytophthora infestans T30-4]EEY67665.1 cleavage induced hypothetical protein [Phytophthora infestans T30-4]|eukprot:XP_002896328.1 cleavage induced hypothetical protein [Phytophthora infestans T30-4]
MSGEELALKTQLLLQEATQITQQAAVESVVESARAPPPESEYQAAKSALVAKLRKKKEANRAHHQQLNRRRLGTQTPQSTVKKNDIFSPRKAMRLAVATTASATSRKKQDMLFKLRTQAIQQGAQSMAEFFGHATYEDHLKAINEEEEKNILKNEKLKEKMEKNHEEQESKDEHEDTEPMDTSQQEEESVKVVRRRNRIQKPEPAAEEDGNEADSEQDDKEGADAEEEMEDATDADKAAAYRNMLRAEALQTRKRKRLVKGGDKFVESEAEEDDEEDVLKIGGLGDFGFGVPQAKTQEFREAEEERNALKLREGDLDHIVDDLSDDERAQEQDLDEMFRREQEDQDRQQVKEVMRNVKEGFGRNRRAFSGLHSGSGARGRFNLDELVAADGSKFEAARLGLLESDEELSEDENGEKKKKDSEEEEEDEEAQMERMLRERFMNQPKIYVTSSESGSDNEEEDEAKKDNGPDGDEVESDEERERQQMKLFSERARINRRMQRMKDLQRQIALENNEADPNVKATAMPNLLLEEDEDSQELMHMMNRTDVDSTSDSRASSGTAQKKARTDRTRPKLGRLNSYGGITSASRGSSSFSRVIGQCKLFSANSVRGGASSKGFVFTSFSSDKAEDGDENAVPNQDEVTSTTRPELGKSKSWSGTKNAKRRGAPGANGNTTSKMRKSGGLFSVLSSFQCVSSTSQDSGV